MCAFWNIKSERNIETHRTTNFISEIIFFIWRWFHHFIFTCRARVERNLYLSPFNGKIKLLLTMRKKRSIRSVVFFFNPASYQFVDETIADIATDAIVIKVIFSLSNETKYYCESCGAQKPAHRIRKWTRCGTVWSLTDTQTECGYKTRLSRWISCNYSNFNNFSPDFLYARNRFQLADVSKDRRLYV